MSYPILSYPFLSHSISFCLTGGGGGGGRGGGGRSYSSQSGNTGANGYAPTARFPAPGSESAY